VFTVADCYAVNPQTRESTGSLFQFVALADVTLNGSGAGNITVAPVYSAAHALATVNTLPGNSKAVVFVGAASSQYAQNLIYHKDAITFRNRRPSAPTRRRHGFASGTRRHLAPRCSSV